MPRSVVNRGLIPYVPWMVFMSAGFMGEARVRRRRVLDGSEGEMECVCSLRGKESISMAELPEKIGPRGLLLGGLYLRTSCGWPYSEKTSVLVWV